MYPSMQLVLGLVPHAIIMILEYNTSIGYMSSQNLYQDLSRIRKDLKNTYKHLKNTCGST